MKWVVDTSAWIQHFHTADPEVSEHLAERNVLMHPIVLGELACGNFKRRDETLGNLRILPRALVASWDEAYELIENERLHGSGLGFSDVQVLASALLSDAGIVTRDKAMKAAARALKIKS